MLLRVIIYFGTFSLKCVLKKDYLTIMSESRNDRNAANFRVKFIVIDRPMP